MSDLDAFASIVDDARRRNVPCVISQNSRAIAYATGPDYKIVRLAHPYPPTHEPLRELAGWYDIEDRAGSPSLP